MVATNDDILTALNKLIELQTPKPYTPQPSKSVTHNGVEVEYNEATKLWHPKK